MPTTAAANTAASKPNANSTSTTATYALAAQTTTGATASLTASCNATTAPAVATCSATISRASSATTVFATSAATTIAAALSAAISTNTMYRVSVWILLPRRYRHPSSLCSWIVFKCDWSHQRIFVYKLSTRIILRRWLKSAQHLQRRQLCGEREQCPVLEL